jgi:hypothetical protein
VYAGRYFGGFAASLREEDEARVEGLREERVEPEPEPEYEEEANAPAESEEEAG